MKYLINPVRLSREKDLTPFEIEAKGTTPDDLLEALSEAIGKRLFSTTWEVSIKYDRSDQLAGTFSVNGNRFGHGRFYAVIENNIPRPEVCCGRCPEIVGGGYDCTCEGNPRCEKWVEEAS